MLPLSEGTCVQTVSWKLCVVEMLTSFLLCSMYDFIFCGTAGCSPEQMTLQGHSRISLVYQSKGHFSLNVA